MLYVTELRHLHAYVLWLCFSDGTAGEVDLADELHGPMFEPLRDWALFYQVFVDDYGAIAWPNGADLAPDAIHKRLQAAADVA